MNNKWWEVGVHNPVHYRNCESVQDLIFSDVRFNTVFFELLNVLVNLFFDSLIPEETRGVTDGKEP